MANKKNVKNQIFSTNEGTGTFIYLLNIGETYRKEWSSFEAKICTIEIFPAQILYTNLN